MTDPLLAELHDLDTIQTTAWRLLARGLADRRSEFHTPTLATVEHGAPALRTVVLRSADAAARQLRFHTDLRSAKIPALALTPMAGVHVYHPGMKLQLRLSGRITCHSDDAVADGAWARSGVAARRTYSIEPGPGTPLDAPEDARLEARDAVAARAVFAVLVLQVERWEWLTLAASLHRRAEFTWDEAGWRGRWVTP